MIRAIRRSRHRQSFIRHLIREPDINKVDRVEVMICQQFPPIVAIVDQCNVAAEPEAFIPLLMYKDVRFRILPGNRLELRPHVMPVDDPFAV